MSRVHQMQVRPRYCECDPMGFVHHTVFPIWFEMGRTELLREAGGTYAQMEREGYLLVVTRMLVQFRRPARYDELLTVETTLRDVGHVKIEHGYRVLRSGELLVDGESTLACMGRDGKVRAIPQSPPWITTDLR